MPIAAGGANRNDSRPTKPGVACSTQAGRTPTTEDEAAPLWRPIPGFPAYEANASGQIRRAGKDRPLAPRRCGRSDQTGVQRYLAVCLSVDGQVTQETVHALVARAFLGPRPPGAVIDHRNADKHDNRPANLEYVSPGENMRRAHSVRALARRVLAGLLTLEQADALIAGRRS